MPEQSFTNKRKKYKILVINCNYTDGFDGISVFSNNLVHELKNNGHTVQEINFGDKKFVYTNITFKDLFYSEVTKNKYYSFANLFNLFNLLHPDKGLRNFIFTNLVNRISKEYTLKFKPDIIHITHVRLFSAISKQVPTVVSLYSEEINNMYPTEYTVRNSSCIHFISNFTQKITNELFAKTFNNRIIYLSVDIEKYKSVPKTDNKTIVSVGRLSPEKNFDTLIKAFERSDALKIHGYKLLIVGDGPERSALVTLANDLGIQSHIKFLGNVSEALKIKILRSAQLFALCPKVYNNKQEGFGIAFIEAQAAGLPIIASKTGGIMEALSNTATYIDNPNDEIEFAKTIDRVLMSNTNSITESINTTFSHEAFIKNTLEMYSSIAINN